MTSNQDEESIVAPILRVICKAFQTWDKEPGTRKEKDQRKQEQAFVVNKLLELGAFYYERQAQDLMDVARNPLYDRRQKN